MISTRPHSATLGLVAAPNRPIQPLGAWAKYFDFSQLKHQDPIKMKKASVFDTLRFMEKVVLNTLSDTKQLAVALKGNTVEQTVRNNWNWLFSHIAYKEDKQGVEQVRRPLRLVYDRLGDCDCFTVFLSSLLTNQGIPHSFRMAKYKGDWQHVYVIVPQAGNKPYYTLDCVLDGFNQEHPYTDKHDHPMIELQYLNGLGTTTGNHPLKHIGDLEDTLKRLVQFAQSNEGKSLKAFVAPLQHQLTRWSSESDRLRIAADNKRLYSHPFFAKVYDYLLAQKQGVEILPFAKDVIAYSPVMQLVVTAIRNKEQGVAGLGSGFTDFMGDPNNAGLIKTITDSLFGGGSNNQQPQQPVYMPPPEPPAPDNTGLYIAMGVLGLVAVGGVAFAVSNSNKSK